MPTCTQIVDALNTLASATTNPNIIMDLTGSTAALSVPYGSIAKVQLSAGGDAVLSVPSGVSVDGKPFKFSVSGNVAQTTVLSGDNVTARLWFGTNLSTADILSSITGRPDSVAGKLGFTFVFYGIWDSVSQVLMGSSSPPLSFTSDTGSTKIASSVSSQSSLQFVVSAQNSGSSSDPGDVLNITDLRWEFF